MSALDIWEGRDRAEGTEGEGPSYKLINYSHHKEDMSLVIVWEEKQAGDGGEGYLVIKGLPVSPQERGIYPDIVLIPGSDDAT